jgi:hypothetical protein
MDLVPEHEKQPKNNGPNGSPQDDVSQHRVEAKAYVFLALWIFADFLVIFGHFSVAVWFFYFVFVAGLGLLTHHAIKGWKPRKKVFIRIYAFACIVLPFLLFWLAKPSNVERPHFILSLEMGDHPDSTVLLTNDCLFEAGFLNEIRKTNDFMLFNGVAASCVVVPVLPGESNKVFNFIVENESPVKVADLIAIFGTLKGSRIGLDPEKWNAIAGVHWFIPGWKQQITNLQFWASQSSWSLNFSDTFHFPPITNFSIPAFNSPTNKYGLFELILRSTGYERLMSANVLFLHVSTNEAFKPFVVPLKQETNGVFNLSFTPKEFEDSQK